MAAISKLSKVVGGLLENRTAGDIARLLESAMNSQPLDESTVSALAAAPKQRSKKAATSRVLERAAVAAALHSGSVAPRRPLNSWMAFRSNYSSIFKAFQQKDRSGFLTRLWQNDPFKAKWSIIAKAYSVIRENTTKNAAPLDKFLSLVCPLIGVIPSDDYMSTMGWEIVEENGVCRIGRLFTPEITAFPLDILTTNLSAEDVVAHCYEVGYVKEDSRDIMGNRPARAALTMAAQPANNLTPAPALAFMPPVVVVPRAQPARVSDTVDLAPSAEADKIQWALEHNNNCAAGAASALRQAVHDLSTQRIPYYDAFDPYDKSPVVWDPLRRNGNGAYSASHLGTYIAPSDAEFPETFDVDDFLSNDIFDLNK